MSKSEEEIIEERKRKLKELLFKKNFIFLVFALVLLILAWHIRTANVSKLRDITTGDYTLGPDLDPYLFLRYAKSIIETGKISEIDSMRYVPLGFKTATETWFLPYLIAFFHKLLNIFNPQVSVNYSAVIFPAFMFLLTVIAFFLLSGKVFEEHKYRWYIAFVASLFLILSPAFLPRTIAGIPEKESAGFFFMFLAFYFFLCSFKESKEKKAYIFGGLAGLSTVCMGLIWGGVIYIFTVIGIFEGFMWLFNKIEKKELISYGIWLATSFTLLPLLYERFSFKGLVTSISSGTSFAVFILIFIDFILFRTKIKNYALIKKLEEKFPKKIISVTFFIIVFIIGSTLIFGTKFITNFVGDILFHLTQPYADRFSFTVAENRQPYFNEWRDEFGPIIKDIPILFSLFFFGSILLFYKTLKIRQKEKIYLTLIYSYFLFSLIFSRYSPQSIMNGTSLISKAFYFSGICVFGLYLIYINYFYEKKKEENLLKESNLNYLFIFSLFFVAVIGARSAIRLVMVLVPPSSIIAAFVPFEILIKFSEKKDSKNMWLVLFASVSFFMILAGFKFYQITYATAQNYAPSIYNQQWQKAMAWVRNNTPENAVFSHWWDYGYWIQSIGNRPTVLDGGNAIVYWDHLLGRHVLTGHSEEEALEFLYTHNASYLLIDPTDIGKYPAYASIGSDENYDRYSWMTTFLLNEKMTKELRNETEFYYEGGFLLDEDFVLKKNDSENFFPGRRAFVPLIKIKIKEQEIVGAEVMFYYQGKREWVPLNCVYYENKNYEFEKKGYDGCFFIIPRVDSSGASLDKKGAGIFISLRVKKTNFARLYLFNQTENFELVHVEDDYIVQLLKAQGIDVRDFVIYGEIRGPIKIWKINYPKDIKANPEYLKTNYPNQDLALAKPGYY